MSVLSKADILQRKVLHLRVNSISSVQITHAKTYIFLGGDGWRGYGGAGGGGGGGPLWCLWRRHYLTFWSCRFIPITLHWIPFPDAYDS